MYVCLQAHSEFEFDLTDFVYFISQLVKKMELLSKELDNQERLLQSIERQPDCDRFVDAWKALVRDTRT